MLEGYRAPVGDGADAIRHDLALELSDLQVMIFKIAYLAGIDMESAMLAGQAKADRRFPDPAAGPPERVAYWQRFRQYLAENNLDQV
jgi:hypothetical protein